VCVEPKLFVANGVVIGEVALHDSGVLRDRQLALVDDVLSDLREGKDLLLKLAERSHLSCADVGVTVLALEVGPLLVRPEDAPVRQEVEVVLGDVLEQHAKAPGARGGDGRGAAALSRGVAHTVLPDAPRHLRARSVRATLIGVQSACETKDTALRERSMQLPSSAFISLPIDGCRGCVPRWSQRGLSDGEAVDPAFEAQQVPRRR
jgi:hypothetical protein